MRWVILALVVMLGFLFAANFIFLVKPVPKAPPPAASAPAPPPPGPIPLPPPPIPPAPSSTTAALTGRVLTADGGKPVAGATVDVDGEVPTVKTGPDGSFRVEGIPPGLRTVEVFHADFCPANREVECIAGKEAAVDLFVLPGAEVEGRVTAGGSPLAGAVVKDRTGAKSAVTGKEGTFVLRGFLPGEEWLEVSAPGFRPQEFDVEIEPGEARAACTFDLRPSWKIVGTVVLEGKPVAGARVAPTWRGIAGEEFEGATTAADGTFVLESAEDLDRGVVWAWKEGAGIGCSEEIDPVDGMTHDQVVVALAASHPATLACTGENGAPVPGAAVEAHMRSESSNGLDVEGEEGKHRPPATLARTGAGGEAALTLQDGRWEFRVRAEGFFGAVVVADAGGEGGPPRIPVALRRGGDLEGRVVDGAGNPVEGASVSAWRYRERDLPALTTGADGRFTFRSLQDEEYSVLASKGGFTGGPAGVVKPGSPLTLTLRTASTIRGRVLLADGRTPARAFTVRLWFEATEDGKPWKDQGWPFRTEEITDPDGRFAIPEVEPGTIGVEAECGDLLSQRLSVPTKAGVDPAEVNLVLKGSASVSGRVLDPEGAAVEGAPVSLRSPWRGATQPEDEDEWANVRQVITGPDGRYEFRVLQPGRYQVDADVEKYFWQVAVLRITEGAAARADLVLGRGGRLRVECVDGEGKPVEWSFLRFLEDEGDGQERYADVIREGIRDGMCALSPEDLAALQGIAPGSYRALVTAEVCFPAEVRVVVKEGQTTTVRATLKKFP